MSNEKKHLSREEIARIEVGHTAISPLLARCMAVVFLLLIFSIPLFQFIGEKNRLTKNQAVPQSSRPLLPPSFNLSALPPTGPELATLWHSHGLLDTFHASTRINARMMAEIKKYENGLGQNSFLSQWTIPRMESLLIGILGAGNEKAYCGSGEWLFYRPDIDYLINNGFLEPGVLRERAKSGSETRQPPQPDPLRGIVDFRNKLRERGIELVVIPAPSKGTVYPEKFSSRLAGRQTPLENPSYAEFKKRLEAEKIRVFDFDPLLLQAKKSQGDALYLKTDTHWAPAGMELSARELAAYLKTQKILSQRPPLKYSRQSRSITALGDIATMLKLPERQNFYRPEKVEIHPIFDPSGQPWAPQTDADVLVLGDSFLNVFSLEGMGWGKAAGFVEQLGYELQRPLDAILINDNASYVTRRELSKEIQRGQDRLAGKRLVIYEFAVRELATGDWKTDLSFKPSSAPRPIQTQTARPQGMAVSGTIQKIGKVPQPGTVPYKDCIVALHLTGIKPLDGGTPLENELVAFAWGLRDNKLEPAADWAPGRLISVKLVPWSSVEKIYGSYNRVELDDERLIMLNNYWVDDGEAPAPTDIGKVASPRQRRSPDWRIAPATPGGVTNAPPTTIKTVKLASPPLAMPRTAPAVTSAVPQTTPAVNGGNLQQAFDQDLSAKAAQLDLEKKSALAGLDGWLFYGPELRSLSVGKFWGADAARVSRSSNPQNADPLPAIVDFNNQLRSANVELLLLPVPAKATIYPDKISPLVKLSPGGRPPRLDRAQQEFYNLLRQQGVNVLDLTDEMIAHREEPAGTMFCRQDTHWSPRAVEWVARRIKETIANRPWLAAVPQKHYTDKEQEITLDGDLLEYLGNKALAKERVKVTVIGSGDTSAPLESWRESPVLLLGDSHNLIYSVGEDMQATSAGFPEHLAAALGFPVDLVAIRGSGATPARVSLLRRHDRLAGKKLVIWCFTSREFTETPGGWAKVPIIPPR